MSARTIIEELVVVGAGPAGCAAAVQGRRLGLKPRLLDETGEVGGLLLNAHCVENYPGVEPMPGAELAARLKAHIARFGVAVERGRASAVSAMTTAPEITVMRAERGTPTGLTLAGDFGSIEARSVILAVGTRPQPLLLSGIAAMAGERLFYEVRALLARIPAPGRVVVIGGGEAALDYALTLADAGAEVTILTRSEGLKTEGRLVDQVKRCTSIAHIGGEEVTHLAPVEQGIRVDLVHVAGAGAGLRPPALHADAVLVAVGRESRLLDLLAAGEMASLTSLDADVSRRATGHILRRGRDLFPGVRTGVAGLFVAGDARTGSLGQVGMAVGDGLAAAMAAAAMASTDRLRAASRPIRGGTTG
jgi:thioredoxin reductase (NADPH)